MKLSGNNFMTHYKEGANRLKSLPTSSSAPNLSDGRAATAFCVKRKPTADKSHFLSTSKSSVYSTRTHIVLLSSTQSILLPYTLAYSCHLFTQVQKQGSNSSLAVCFSTDKLNRYWEKAARPAAQRWTCSLP